MPKCHPKASPHGPRTQKAPAVVPRWTPTLAFPGPTARRMTCCVGRWLPRPLQRSPAAAPTRRRRRPGRETRKRCRWRQRSWRVKVARRHSGLTGVGDSPPKFIRALHFFLNEPPISPPLRVLFVICARGACHIVSTSKPKELPPPPTEDFAFTSRNFQDSHGEAYTGLSSKEVEERSRRFSIWSSPDATPPQPISWMYTNSSWGFQTAANLSGRSEISQDAYLGK